VLSLVGQALAFGFVRLFGCVLGGGGYCTWGLHIGCSRDTVGSFDVQCLQHDDCGKCTAVGMSMIAALQSGYRRMRLLAFPLGSCRLALR
jgi:hypothetical protein